MAITVSVMTGGINSHPTTSEEANGLSTDFVSEGVIGATTSTSGVAPMTGGFAVNAQGTPDMTVAVTAGVAYVTGTPTSQNSQTFRVKLTANENVTISSNSSGSTKYDWVYIKLDATLLNAPTLAGTTTATLVTSRSTSNTSDDGTPPTYGYPIAIVTVANGASSITNGTIRDIRNGAVISNDSNYNKGWISGSGTWTYASATTFTVPSADAANMSVGTKIWLTQTTSKYYYVTGISGTTITVSGGTDYTVANATIASPYYSNQETPAGFPQYFAYTPAWTSSGTQPAINSGTLVGRFTMAGKHVTAQIYWKADGTTTFGTGSYFFGLPVTAASNSTQNLTDTFLTIGIGRLQDTSGSIAAPVYPELETSTTIQPVYYTSPSAAAAVAVSATAPWTWATTDRIAFNVNYEAA